MWVANIHLNFEYNVGQIIFPMTKNNTYCWYCYRVNIIPADDLAVNAAVASAGIILPWDTPSRYEAYTVVYLIDTHSLLFS